MARVKKLQVSTAANLGFEKIYWATADYKHVVLGLISLKYL